MGKRDPQKSLRRSLAVEAEYRRRYDAVVKWYEARRKALEKEFLAKLWPIQQKYETRHARLAKEEPPPQGAEKEHSVHRKVLSHCLRTCPRL